LDGQPIGQFQEIGGQGGEGLDRFEDLARGKTRCQFRKTRCQFIFEKPGVSSFFEPIEKPGVSSFFEPIK
jgi:hypothetical protein